MKKLLLLFVSISIFTLAACSDRPEPGPDKTIAGAVLGAGWGAGAGAVVGSQVDNTGAGAAVGAGFGAVGGAISGYSYDKTEDVIIEQEKQLASLRIQNSANRRELNNIQGKLDHMAHSGVISGVYQVYFDVDQTNLRTGAVANLETLAASLMTNPSGYMIHIVGHADDAGSPQYNERLAESRARSVSSYIAAKGVPTSGILVSSYGSKRPIATNVSPTGRQLNRRVDVFISPKG